MSRKKNILIVTALAGVAGLMGLLLCVVTGGSFTGEQEAVVATDQGTSRPAEARKEHRGEDGCQETESAGAPSDETAELEDISKELSEDLCREAVSVIKNPIHPGRARLQQRMRQETFQQSFDRLADNDSLAMLIPTMASVPFSPGCYEADVRIMWKMTRLRKLLADARMDPEPVSAFLQEQLVIISHTFPAAREELMRVLHESSGEGKVILHGLPEAQKQRLLSTAAVYVLSEMDVWDSLPLLATLSTYGKPNYSSRFAGSCQVNPTFLLYCMHGLVDRFPEGRLSVEARRARVEYLTAAAEAGVRKARPAIVADWNATYHEDDFRRTLPGRLYISKSQPTMELTVFPPLGRLGGLKVRKLLGKVKAFVEKAFPQRRPELGQMARGALPGLR